MSTKKSALGKGLGALIPEINEVKEKESSVTEIDINEIMPNEKQPRKKFDEENIKGLAESIKEHGIIQPILVRKEGEYYKIVAGERRWRAARIAGLKKVPVIQKEMTDREMMEISLIENLQREDLNPIEEALAYKKLIEDFNLTQEQIAERVGKSRPVIANSLRLLNLDKRVIDFIIQEKLSEGHGRILASIENKETQFEIAKKIIEDELNVRQTEKIIKNIKEKSNKKSDKPKKDTYIKEIEEKLMYQLGTKVSISNKKKKGIIEIEYYSKEDLERILDLFNI
ncbi:chromosome segregation DNA-binding protein [Caloramator quimbayensis]|uniref:Chromosome segregation DNA-binding protein n=1 Tax=Caloramator quimbayensis TaxID=1147123 RepID=A0A1T4Y6X0_9CLOT|nr:ParB/RepB/Spo0J family partition protein [Caloramator quimbayensis]SKA97480.1 chromosome segregation DNA-binding protein [Caloramator quimbayensis]